MNMNKPWMSKKEISHSELVREGDPSARYVQIGFEQLISITDSNGQIQSKPFVLKDKVIYEINICPYCGSQATYHHRVQANKDIIGNVWRVEDFFAGNGYSYRKYDYCLECRKEFLMELYIWEREKLS